MRYLKTYEGRKPFSGKYNKGDYLLINHKTLLYEKDLQDIGYNSHFGFGDIHKIETLNVDYSICEVLKYDPTLNVYSVSNIFSNQSINLQSDIIIKKLTDDELLEEIEKMEEIIKSHIETHRAKREAEKYNL